MGHHVRERVAIDRTGNTWCANHDPLSRRDAVLAVNCIRRRVIELIVVNKLEMLVLRNVPVEPCGWKTANVASRILELIIEPIEVVGRCDATLQSALRVNGRVDNIESRANLWIDRSGETLGRGQSEKINRSDCTAGVFIRE